MAGDSFGKLFCITTWGESHGPAVGVVIEGCPPLLSLSCKEEALPIEGKSAQKCGVPLYTCEEIQKELDRRRPGQSGITTARKESDIAHIFSGIFNGKTTGAPISVLTWNSDARSEDYEIFKNVDRPGHAGFAYRQKYGIYDYRGGGRSSYRETWGRVVAGAIAKKILKEQCGTEIIAYVDQVGNIIADINPDLVTAEAVESHPVRCPDLSAAKKMEALIEKTRKEGDSIGGAAGVVVRNVPAGLGEPVFDKVDADLFKALKSIHATKSVEIGLGTDAAEMKGSEHNDPFTVDKSGKIHPLTNKAGGTLGGISTGENLLLRVSFKPTATIAQEQKSVTVDGKPVVIKGAGRHDVCVLPRAVATVEAMTALVLVDHYLRNRAQCGFLKK